MPSCEMHGQRSREKNNQHLTASIFPISREMRVPSASRFRRNSVPIRRTTTTIRHPHLRHCERMHIPSPRTGAGTSAHSARTLSILFIAVSYSSIVAPRVLPITVFVAGFTDVNVSPVPPHCPSKQPALTSDPDKPSSDRTDAMRAFAAPEDHRRQRDRPSDNISSVSNDERSRKYSKWPSQHKKNATPPTPNQPAERVWQNSEHAAGSLYVLAWMITHGIRLAELYRTSDIRAY